MRHIALGVFRIASARGDDFPFIEKRVGHRDGLIEKPARIIAQIQHDAFDGCRWPSSASPFAFQLLDGLFVEL